MELIENGKWANMAAKAMRIYLESMKNITVIGETVSIKSTLKEGDMPAVEALAKAVVEAGK